MKAYKKSITMKSTGRITLSGLPFKAGERLDIIVIADEQKKDAEKKLKSLFKQTRRIPSIKKISEEEICREIKDFRSGK